MHANVIRRQFTGRFLRQVEQPCLAGKVSRTLWLNVAAVCANIDDHPAPLLAHDPPGLLHHKECTAQVDIDRTMPVPLVHLAPPRPRPPRGKPPGCCLPNSASRARHQYDLILKLAHSLPSFSGCEQTAICARFSLAFSAIPRYGGGSYVLAIFNSFRKLPCPSSL